MEDIEESSNTARHVASAAIQRGWVAIELRRFSAAEREARAALAASPQSVEARLLLIESLLLRERDDEARAVVEEALALEPSSPLVQHAACVIFRRCFELDRALDAANEYARLAPHDPTAHVLVAEVMFTAGNRRATIDAARRALALHPENPRALEQLGVALLDEDPKSAEAVFIQQLALAPNESAIFNNLGVALERQNRLWEAAKVFETAVRLDPTSETSRNNTRTTLRRWTAPTLGVGLSAAALAGSKGLLVVSTQSVGRSLARASTAQVVAVLAVIALAIAGVVIFAFARSALRVRRLAREDPALYKMFRDLERDESDRNDPRG